MLLRRSSVICNTEAPRRFTPPSLIFCHSRVSTLLPNFHTCQHLRPTRRGTSGTYRLFPTCISNSMSPRTPTHTKTYPHRHQPKHISSYQNYFFFGHVHSKIEVSGSVSGTHLPKTDTPTQVFRHHYTCSPSSPEAGEFEMTEIL